LRLRFDNFVAPNERVSKVVFCKNEGVLLGWVV